MRVARTILNRRLVLRRSPALHLAALAFAMMIIITFVGCWSGSATPAYKNPSKKATPIITGAQKMTPEDLLFEEEIGQLRVSPDGSKVAWVRTKYTPDSATPLTDVFLTSTADLSTTQLTTGMSVTGLKWSPDGSQLAFMSDAPAPGAPPGAAGEQVWVLPASRGKAAQVTRASGGVKAYD